MVAEKEKDKEEVKGELETAADYILEIEAKLHKAQNNSMELLKQLKSAQSDIEALQNYITELKNKTALYIPCKDDLLDLKLADFINSYPHREKIMKLKLQREYEGNYTFGSKKITLCLQKDGIHARKGGGFQGIEEFLE